MTAPGPDTAKIRASLVDVGAHLREIITALDRLADALEEQWDVLQAVAQELEEGSQ